MVQMLLNSAVACILWFSYISGLNSERTDLADEGDPDGSSEILENSDVGLRVPDLVVKYGYSVESHPVITEDGYILTMHRIPYGKNTTARKDKVVLIQHGLLCSSADWVMMGPANGLAYYLADKGYDVWMGNTRGNTYSRKHMSYNPDIYKEKFWDFSWHEIGIYDLPAMIDKILETTGVEKVYYIGHSQGTTAFLVMASERPEYNDKIRLMSALAPVAFMKHFPNPLLKYVAKMRLIELYNMLGAYEFLPSFTFMQMIGQAACNDKAVFKEICSNSLFLMAGFDEPELNKTVIPVIMSNTPAGTSTKQLVHYIQHFEIDQFQKFDYGVLRNLEIYGPDKSTPPEYNLAKITAPVALFYSLNDQLSAPEDIKKLHRVLPNSVRLHEVENPLFNHLDFIWGIHVVEQVYKPMFNIMEDF